MIFIETNKVIKGGIFIKGRFVDKSFNNPAFEQELDLLGEIEQKTINNTRAEEPDIAYTLSFNHTDGHDGKFPLMAKMRDWWGLDKRNSQVWLLTQYTGGTSTVHGDILEENDTRYLIFLEDWKPGQWWQFNDETYTKWKAGTVLHFDFNKPHGSANASGFPRTIMQISHKLMKYHSIRNNHIGKNT
jgi:hypothetical protein